MSKFLDAWRSVLNPDDVQYVFIALEQELNHIAVEQGQLTMTIPQLYIEAIK